MRLDRFFSQSRIIELRSDEFAGALEELLDALPPQALAKRSREQLLKELLEREKTMTSQLGNGVALPHLRVPMKQPYVFVVGRCPHGLSFNGGDEYHDLRLVFLMLAGENEKSYLTVLASLARVFQEEALLERMIDAPDLEAFQDAVKQVFGRGTGKSKSQGNKFNRLILAEAAKVARGAECSAIMIFGDTFTSAAGLTDSFGSFKTLLVTQTAKEVAGLPEVAETIIPVRSFSSSSTTSACAASAASPAATSLTRSWWWTWNVNFNLSSPGRWTCCRPLSSPRCWSACWASQRNWPSRAGRGARWAACSSSARPPASNRTSSRWC
jgi:mannitol/fructose-specific phosphotransferase system IIA component (Ntr-type)